MRVLCTFFLCLFVLSSFASGLAAPERKKTIVLLYDVEQQDRLNISNKFGQVKVDLWKRSEIQITVRVTAHSLAEETLESYLNAVVIDERREGSQINIATVIQSLEGQNWPTPSDSKDSLIGNYLQIDYTISMPAQNGLTVNNKFGNTIISTFKAPLAVFVQYGNFSANSLTHSETSIKVEYGTAEIKKMNDGGVDVSYGNLDVKSANIVKLSNKWGKLRLGKANELTTTVSYSETDIGIVHQSALITISFSKKFHIERLPETLANLDMAISYSSVVLPVDRNSNYNFDVSMTNGGFTYPANRSIVLMNQSTTGTESSSVKRYSGTVGKGTGSKVQLVGDYSTVGFK